MCGADHRAGGRNAIRADHGEGGIQVAEAERHYPTLALVAAPSLLALRGFPIEGHPLSMQSCKHGLPMIAPCARLV